jgi:hypothetical protein
MHPGSGGRAGIGDPCDREGKGDGVQLEEPPFFLLVVDDVQCVDDGLNAAIGTPDCEKQAGQERASELHVALGKNTADLVLDNRERALGQELTEESDVIVYSFRVGEQRE